MNRKSFTLITKELTVQNVAGFHVRDASLVCKTAMKFSSNVYLSNGGYSADCKSCLDLLTLMAPQGTVLTITAEGEDSKAAVDAIETLFNHKFYEDEFAAMEP
ncbi:MAG: HPr family phosphocarrier protein, partial [Thermoguttaceae bacterium]|nr:HPr family phosphocarrier protein [Thermoguttaceae bacterium]